MTLPGNSPSRGARARSWLIGLVVVVSGVAGTYYVARDHFRKREAELARLEQEQAGKQALGAVQAELDARDPGWRLEEIEAARPALPRGANSALVVRELGTELAPSVFAAWLAREERRLRDVPPPAGLNAGQLRSLRAAILPLDRDRRAALALKDLPRGRYFIRYSPDLIGTDFPDAASYRRVLQFLRYDALLRAEVGDLDGAVQACLALLNAARSVGEEPMLLAQLERLTGQEVVARAVERVLAQGEAPEPALRELQAALADEARAPLLWYAFRGVRGGASRVYRAFATEGEPGADDGTLAAHLRYLTRVVEASKLPAERQAAAMAEIRADLKRQPPLVRQLVPDFVRPTEVSLQAQASLRGAVVAVAAERYRLRHRRWPDAPAELVADGLLHEVPADPFAGGPLRWRRLDDGVVAYSVGYDRADNAGAITRGNPSAPGTDLGVRLWDVYARRDRSALLFDLLVEFLGR